MSVATAPRPTRRTLFIGIVLLLGLAALSVGPLGCNSETEEARSERSAADEAIGDTGKRVQLNMGIDDRTTENPPSEGLAIEVPGEDLWTPDLEHGGSSRLFGEYPVGESYEFYLYPEGKEGPRQTVSFSMKPDMSSALASSKTYIRIYDDRVVIEGPAVPDGEVTLDRPASGGTP